MPTFTKISSTPLWIATGVIMTSLCLIVIVVSTGMRGEATLVQKNADSFAHMLKVSQSGAVFSNEEEPLYAAPHGL